MWLQQPYWRSTIFLGSVRSRFLREYRNAERRLLFFDYDGTLREFTKRPDEAVPDSGLLSILEKLTKDPRNEVVIVSGRDRYFLERHFAEAGVGLVAGHGVWIRSKGEEWRLSEPLSDEWKKILLPIMERFSLRTPGASVEEKDYSLAWHYRRAEPDLSVVRVAELKEALLGFINSYQLTVLEGNRVLEVKPSGINKGRGAAFWLAREAWDFILALGDDVTDEDLFAVIPKKGYPVKVGPGSSRAKFFLESPREVRRLLAAMGESPPVLG